MSTMGSHKGAERSVPRLVSVACSWLPSKPGCHYATGREVAALKLLLGAAHLLATAALLLIAAVVRFGALALGVLLPGAQLLLHVIHRPQGHLHHSDACFSGALLPFPAKEQSKHRVNSKPKMEESCCMDLSLSLAA